MKAIIKTKLSPLVFLLILVSLIFLSPLFSSSFYLSHDGEAHVARFAAYYKAFFDGQFPLRWGGDLNYGYGSPVFIFYYPLPGLLSIPLHLLGLSFENTFKLLIAFFFGLSFVTFFLWARELTMPARRHIRSEIAFLGALLYGLAPYHFLNLYVRGDIAEMAALAIVPLVFLFIKKSIEKKSSNFIILASIAYALLILSHNAISLMFSPVILIYSIMLSRNCKGMIFGLTPIVLGLVLSSFFWIPALVESRFTNAKLFVGDMFKDHFPNLLQLIYSHWGFGPDLAKAGGLSPQIGILSLAFALGAAFLLFKKTDGKKIIVFWLGVFIITVFFSLSISSHFWSNLPLLKLFQFPWRIIGLASFVTSVLALFFFDRFVNRQITIILTIFIVLFSAQFLKIHSVNNKTDLFYLNYPGTTYYHGQASSIWTAGDFSSFPKARYEVIEGEGEVRQVKRHSNVHEFYVDASTDLRIVDNTVYFPGWQVAVDGNKSPIQFQDSNYRGLITFNIPKGMHNVRVIFGESPARLSSDYLSLLGVFIIATLFIFRTEIHKIIKVK